MSKQRFRNFSQYYTSKRASQGGDSGKEPACQCRRHKKCRLHPWVGKIPWRRAWKPTPVILAWRIPWTLDPGRLQSKDLHRVRHDWSNLALKNARTLLKSGRTNITSLLFNLSNGTLTPCYFSSKGDCNRPEREKQAKGQRHNLSINQCKHSPGRSSWRLSCYQPYACLGEVTLWRIRNQGFLQA